jgi:hypothetical protein
MAPGLMLLFFVLVAALIGVRTARNLEIPGQPDLPNYGMQDFRDAIYYPVRTLLDGDNPYSPSAIRRHYAPSAVFPLYTPVTLVVHLPFGFLAQRPAEVLDFFVNLAATLLLAFVSLRLCGFHPAPGTVFGVGALILVSRPGHMNLYIGECAAYVVVAMYLAFRYASTRPLRAAACLAFASLKPTFVVPLAILMVAKGGTRAVLVGTAASVLVSVAMVHVLAHAAGGIAGFLDSMRENVSLWSAQPDALASSPFPVDAIAFVQRLLGETLPVGAQLAMSAGIVSLGALAVARMSREDGASAALFADAIMCVTALTCTHHQIYEGLILTLPIVGLASGRLELPSRPFGRRVGSVLLVLLAVAPVNYLATYGAIGRLALTGLPWLVITSANGAALLLAFLVLLVLAFFGVDNRPRAEAVEPSPACVPAMKAWDESIPADGDV